jgi:hypothetical protein
VNRYSALALINPGERAEPLALDFTLEPARTLHGTVGGPDGEPLTGVEVAGLTRVSDEEMLDGSSFTVAGLNPRCPRDLVFHHRGKSLGKVLTVRGDATGPLAVRLDPCGSIIGRLVDRVGKPIPGVALLIAPHGDGADVSAETARTDRDGRFRGVVLPGTRYTVTLWLGSRRLLEDVGEMEVEPGGSKDLGDLPVTD